MDDEALGSAVDATLTGSRALLGVVAGSVAEALDEVTLPQLRVLVLVSAGGPVRVTTLADRLGVNQSTFSRSLDRLVTKGLVVRTANPESRREVLVGLTGAGRELVDSVTRRRREALARILTHLTAAEQRAVSEALTAFNVAAGEPDPADLLVLGLD